MYEPDTPVLVAVLNNLADWARVQTEHWYRIPLNRAPRHMAAEIVAWYQTKAFGDEGAQIRWYAPIIRCRLATRRELLPNEPEHPRADERYWRLDVGDLQALPRPIPASRFRRVTFIPTRWERLLQARDVTELWLGDTALAELCQTLEAEGFSIAKRQLRDDEPNYSNPLPNNAPMLYIHATLEGAVVTWAHGELRFAQVDLAWNLAACVAAVRARFKPSSR